MVIADEEWLGQENRYVLASGLRDDVDDVQGYKVLICVRNHILKMYYLHYI